MLDPREEPHYQPLDAAGARLAVRTAADARDVDRVAEFNGLIHGPGVAGMTRDLFLRHPHTRGRDLIFVEDLDSGQVISSLCVIPWTLDIGGALVRSGEMGIVGTLESHRRRGLIRAQMPYYQQRLGERGCALSHIQGIPFYYRQFGYEYAMPLEPTIRVEHREVPEPPDPAPAFAFRPAADADLPALLRMYEAAAGDLDIRAVRDEATWRYLLAPAPASEMEAETWMIDAPDGAACGYLRLPKRHFGAELTVNETSRLSFDAALACLNHLKKLSLERGTPGLRLCLPAGNTLARLAHSLGAHDRGAYAWQIMVPDLAALLRALGPALERRLVDSPFAGLTRDVPIGFYREHTLLRFEGGRLAEVADTGHDDHGNNLPPRAFIPLALGYRTWQEQHAAYPDLGVWGTWPLLFEVLFPKVSSYLYTIY